ncbi:Hypothetical protein NTJ_08749 [Nesidiocoris tenuis]|uniref:Uncharacterized protein n=1 Tax=Nesidiocoris tenuis TaxID=355587 RepID=A0ABN7AYE3_9HEMI|nr:Hypothetical protein NTJ_08749 [Nesidiocoris tenuis]
MRTRGASETETVGWLLVYEDQNVIVFGLCDVAGAASRALSDLRHLRRWSCRCRKFLCSPLALPDAKPRCVVAVSRTLAPPLAISNSQTILRHYSFARFLCWITPAFKSSQGPTVGDVRAEELKFRNRSDGWKKLS